MKFHIIVFVIVFQLVLICENTVIKFVYFDPSTTITAEQNDGVVILELVNGTKSTVCMNNVYDNNNANVICKMMKYTGGTITTAYSLISSTTSSIGSALYQNINCKGDETTLEDCPNFSQISNRFICNNHNQDLHVKCTGAYQYDLTTLNVLTCSGSLSAGSQGILSIQQNSVTAYFCGINRNFGPTEAMVFCSKLLCQNTTYAKIVEGYPATSIRVIGGFNNMTCNGTTCFNVYPYQSNRCTPDTNIAVICTNDSAVAYPSPSVTCSSSAMTVSWDATTYNATIANNFFAILWANRTNCTSVSVGPSVTSTVYLPVNFGNCDMIVTGTATSISFIFQVVRMYPKINNIITNPDEYFNVSCVIQRKDMVVQGPLLVQPVALPPSSGNTTIPNTLTLYSDSGFKDQIPDFSGRPIGSRIYALVQFVNPPPNIILVLNHCYYGQSQINLIFNRCPSTQTVIISTVNQTAKSFSFVLTQNVNSGSQSQIVCHTSKCSTSETNCATSC